MSFWGWVDRASGKEKNKAERDKYVRRLIDASRTSKQEGEREASKRTDMKIRSWVGLWTEVIRGERL